MLYLILCIDILAVQSRAASQSPRDTGICESSFIPVKDGHSPTQVLWWGLWWMSCCTDYLILNHCVLFLKLLSIVLFISSQNGFDYLLTYSDDPQTVFPRYCVSWMVSSGEYWKSHTLITKGLTEIYSKYLKTTNVDQRALQNTK